MAWVASWLAASMPSTARAEEETARVESGFRLDWVRTGTSTAGCPAGAEMEREVRRRLSAPESADPVEAIVSRTAEGFAVRAVAISPLGERRERRLETEEDDCGRLARAAAVAIALLVDPWADASEPARGARGEAEATPPDDPAEAIATAAAPAPARPIVTPGGIDLLAGVLGQAGTLPAASGGVRLEGRWRLAGPFAIGLGLEALPEVRTEAFGFSVVAGSIGASAMGRAGPFSFGGGLDLLGGVMSAVVYPSEEFSPSDPGSHPWAALSADGRVGLTLVDRFGLELRAGPVVSITRQRFDVRGAEDPAFREEPVAFRGFLAGVLRFDE